MWSVTTTSPSLTSSLSPAVMRLKSSVWRESNFFTSPLSSPAVFPSSMKVKKSVTPKSFALTPTTLAMTSTALTTNFYLREKTFFAFSQMRWCLKNSSSLWLRIIIPISRVTSPLKTSLKELWKSIMTCLNISFMSSSTPPRVLSYMTSTTTQPWCLTTPVWFKTRTSTSG